MTIPKIKHDLAEGVGLELRGFLAEHSEWALPDCELVWADAVQLELRRAAEMQADASEHSETSTTVRPQGPRSETEGAAPRTDAPDGLSEGQNP